MSFFTIGWLVWIGFFVVLEGVALTNKKENDTLSSHVWKWFAIKKDGKLSKTRRTTLAAGLLWLSIHFLTGGWM